MIVLGELGITAGGEMFQRLVTSRVAQKYACYGYRAQIFVFCKHYVWRSHSGGRGFWLRFLSPCKNCELPAGPVTHLVLGGSWKFQCPTLPAPVPRPSTKVQRLSAKRSLSNFSLQAKQREIRRGAFCRSGRW